MSLITCSMQKHTQSIKNRACSVQTKTKKKCCKQSQTYAKHTTSNLNEENEATKFMKIGTLAGDSIASFTWSHAGVWEWGYMNSCTPVLSRLHLAEYWGHMLCIVCEVAIISMFLTICCLFLCSQLLIPSKTKYYIISWFIFIPTVTESIIHIICM